MDEAIILRTLQENYDEKITDVEFLRDGGGKTYIAHAENKKYLLKIAGNTFHDTIRQSVNMICFLSEKHFPVPSIVKTRSGKAMLEQSSTDEDSLFILSEYITGKEPDLTQRAEQIGDLIGQLHALLSIYEGKFVKRDFHFFIERYVDILHRKQYPKAEIYAEIGKKLWTYVKDCPVSVCHGDLHRGNLLETADGKIYLLDFDTICTAPRMFDVMVMCDMSDYFHLKPDDVAKTTTVYNHFLKGYTKQIALTEEERASLPAWIAIRHFQLQATIVEIYGIDCIDERFIDDQLQWIQEWCNITGVFL